jgi:hypothetical protein
MKINIKKTSLLLLVITFVLLINNCTKEENPIIQENNPSLDLIYPVGGENIPADTTIKIKWSSAFIDSISIHLSKNNGINWVELSNSISAELGDWDWITPEINSDSCKIKIIAKSNPTINDESNSSFSIYVDATLDLLTPNGGEIWESLTDYSIEWTSENINNIIIEYTSNNGTDWQIIDTVSASSGNFLWKTPYQPSDDYKVRISSSEYPDFKDESENNFTIIVSSRIIQSLSYYPLAIGNKWFYKTITYDCCDTTISYGEKEVTNLVLLSNNKQYFKISSDYYPYSSYERLDSIQGLVYGYSGSAEYIVDDLITEPGNIVFTARHWNGVGPGVLVLSEDIDTVLGTNTTTRSYLTGDGNVSRGYKLSKYFGETYWYSSYFTTTEIKLKGALINDILYGDTTLPTNVNKIK